jgi:putative sigma-54 modulation protein
MRITKIMGTNLELTDAIRDYVEEKTMSLEKFCEDVSPCDLAVEVGKTSERHQKGDIWRCELMLTLPGKTLRTERVTDDLYSAIDTAKDDLKRQLVEYKEQR